MSKLYFLEHYLHSLINSIHL